MLSVLAGHRRYAHITTLRCDPVNPPESGFEPLVPLQSQHNRGTGPMAPSASTRVALLIPLANSISISVASGTSGSNPLSSSGESGSRSDFSVAGREAQLCRHRRERRAAQAHQTRSRGGATRQQIHATKLLFEILGKVDPRVVVASADPATSSLADEAIEQVREKLARLARDHSASPDDAEPPKGTE
jgi:hypothetical protein